jgi:hypothetical protein
MRSVLVAVVALTAVAAEPALAAEVRKDLPAKIDASSKYIFYLHGISVELHGPDSYNRGFRKKYQTTLIARRLAERGFIVVTEARAKGTLVPAYADKLASQIAQLLAAGVPPKNIVVVGHSKGGFIALATAARALSADVSFVLMAACPLPTTHDIAGIDARAFFEGMVARSKGRISGRILSIYDVTDGWMGSAARFLRTMRDWCRRK